MRYKKIILVFVACLIPSVGLCQEGSRKDIKGVNYKIEVMNSEVKITRKLDGRVKMIDNILWGDHPMKKYLPSRMYDEKGGILIVPMMDYSYYIVDLKDYFEAGIESPMEGITKIVGNGQKGRGYSRTPLFWGLDEIYSDGVIKGFVITGEDKTLHFYIHLYETSVLSDSKEIAVALRLRKVSGDNSYEIPFLIRSDKDAFEKIHKEVSP